MIDDFEVRASTPGDLDAIEAIYPDAFPNEDLVPLVRDLLTGQNDVLSLVGTVGSSLIAHVIFTKCSVRGSPLEVALLGPVAVAPAWQKRGAGSRIIRSGLQRLQHDGMRRVFVLGDPAYYGRFGFSPEANVAPPYTLPSEWGDAWQSIRLGAGDDPASGTICLPKPWMREDLWAPGKSDEEPRNSSER